MTYRIIALGAVLSGALVAGCAPPVELDDPPEPQRSRPSPSTSAMRADLVTALQRLDSAPFRFAATGGVPNGGTVTASGAVDPAGKRYESTLEITGASPVNLKRTVIGSDCYLKQATERHWVRLDMARLKPDSPLHFDVADPTGVVALTTAMGKAWPVRRGPDGWTGEVSVNSPDGFLPIGAPSFVHIGPDVPFTVTVDGQGLVTAVSVELSPTSGPKLTIATTFTGHGAPVQINAPPKGSTREADELFYK